VSRSAAPARPWIVRAGEAWARPGAGTLLAALGALTLVRLLFVAAGAYPLDPEEAQYWSYGEAPAFGYYSKPPLLPWLIALATGVAGDTAFGVRLGAPLLHAATAWLVYLTARHLFDERTGFWSGLIYATLPGVSFSAGLMTTDVPLLVCWAIALFAFVRALESADLRWWAAAGAALGFGLLAKYTAIALLPSALLLVALSRPDRRALSWRGPLIALALALLVILPNLAWNAQHGFATIAHVGDNAGLGGELFHPDRLLAFLGAQAGIFNPIFFAVLLWLLVRWRELGRDRRLLLLLCFTAPLLGVMTLESFLSRAHGNWAAAAYVSAAIAVPAWLLAAGRARWLRIGGAVNVAFAALWMGYALTVGAVSEALPARLDALARLRGAPELGARVAAALERHPDARLLLEDRRLMALCLFYADVPLARAAKWNPDAVTDNHYDLVAGLEAGAKGRFLLVSGATRPAHIVARFAEVTELQPVVVRTHADRERRHRLFVLAGFTGYADR